LKKIYAILSILILAIALNNPLIAQDKELSIMAPYVMAGKWTGKIIQQKGGIAEEYYYEIELSLSGTELSGKGFIKADNNYGHFEISGTLKGNLVKLEDLRISNENIRERAAWCIKKMELKLIFRNGSYCLEGPWTGYSQLGNCSPGNIYLKKSAIKA
jgi:hypothetical protein